MARAQRRVRSDTHGPGVVARIVFTALRRGLDDERPLEPNRVRLRDARGGGDAKPEHFKPRCSVEVAAADAKLHRRSALPTGGENVAGERLDRRRGERGLSQDE